jgi:hypothetical protein
MENWWYFPEKSIYPENLSTVRLLDDGSALRQMLQEQ